LQTKNYIISRFCEVRVENLERLFQIAVILGKATEAANDIYPNTTVILEDIFGI